MPSLRTTTNKVKILGGVVLFFCLFAVQPALALIQGTISEQNTSRKISNASVKILSLTGKTIALTLSIPSGSYKITNNISGFYMLICSSSGYQSQTILRNITTKGANVFNFALKPVIVDGASFVSQSVPATMIAGQVYFVSITMKNIGKATWTNALNYRLGSDNPRDTATWGISRILLSEADSIASMQKKTFTFSVKAPQKSGNYNFQWKMLRESAAWFGDSSSNVIVKVQPVPVDNASFVSQSVPATMITGQSYSVSITMKNTGNTTWNNALNYRLGSQNPQDNGIWGIGRVVVSNSDSIAPGKTKTFIFNVKAPQESGSYNFQWRMLRELVAWFGDYSSNVVVKASASPKNTPPKITAFSPSNRSTLISGDSLKVSVTAVDAEKDLLSYRYSIDDKVVKDWNSSASYLYLTAAKDRGRHKIKVEVRDGKGASVSQQADIYIFRQMPKL